MKSITSDQYLAFLKTFGLSLSISSGGSQPYTVNRCTVAQKGEMYTLSIDSGPDIIFLEPELFISTVNATEASLQVQLFTPS
jgi:hypothetical protein